MQTDLVRPAPAAPSAGDVLTAVREVLADLLRRPVDSIAEGADLESDLGVDSLTMIDLTVSIEERFDIAVPANASPADLSIRTVGDLARFVGELVAAQRKEVVR